LLLKLFSLDPMKWVDAIKPNRKLQEPDGRKRDRQARARRIASEKELIPWPSVS